MVAYVIVIGTILQPARRRRVPCQVMLAPRAVLLTLPSDGNRPHWSYHHTGTLPRLISFVSHSYANTGGVGVFFPFWYGTSGIGHRHSPQYSSSFFSHSCALFCAFLQSTKTQLSSF